MRRKIFYAPILFAFGIGVLGNQPAWAAGGDCPAAFDSDDCDVGATSVCYIATPAGETQMLCDLSAAGGDSTATVVRNFNGANVYSAWGSYGDTSTKFCCAYNAGALGFDAVKIDGSDYNDTLKYTYNGTHELSETGIPLHATIDGHDGNDTVTGSNRSAAYYFEWFEGGNLCSYPDEGGGDDTIVGGGGDDTIRGDCGNDLLLGGPGSDDIGGGDDGDTILGGSGLDWINGDDGNDFISGGDDADEIDNSGRAGTDVICGDDGGDILWGNTNEGDTLYGRCAGDTLQCDLTTTTYSNAGTLVNCDHAVQSGRPETCPE